MKFLLALGAAYLAGEAYSRYVPAERKKEFEEHVDLHHGEAGVLMTGMGLVVRSPVLTGCGIGLMLHDRRDWRVWFTDDKRATRDETGAEDPQLPSALSGHRDLFARRDGTT